MVFSGRVTAVTGKSHYAGRCGVDVGLNGGRLGRYLSFQYLHNRLTVVELRMSREEEIR